MSPERAGTLDTAALIDVIFRDPKTVHGLSDFVDLGSPIHSILNIFPREVTKDATKETRYFLRCMKRDKDIQVWSQTKSNPEEIIRQLWLYRLQKEYGYPLDDIEVEYQVTFGTGVSKKPADIVVFERGTRTAKIVIECKKPKRSDGIAQLKSYLNAEGSPVGCWSNGRDRILLYRPYPKDFEDTLTELPRFLQSPDEVLSQELDLADLRVQFDFSGIIQNLEELVLANSGVDEFNEIFKIIFAKLYDEKTSMLYPNRKLRFRKCPKEADTQRAISELFLMARDEWPGIFEESEDIKLSRHHLQVVIGPLERIRLLGANLRVVDDAFEYLMPNVAKKKNGQFFTPRYVIDMCVKMLNPQDGEHVLDPACGSAGFLVHAMAHVMGSDSERKQARSAYASKYLWGFDFDERSAKVARALMLVAGDGHSRIFRVNTLDPREWFGYSEGAELRAALAKNKLTEAAIPLYRDLEANDGWEYFKKLKFDVILTNPPFAGEIRDIDLLSRYTLGQRAANKKNGKEERDVLFIERCLDFLRPGGRIALVLPQGKFNNLTLGHIRDFVAERAQILAVVGLHGNTFKPHTGTKTSVLFLRKFSSEDLEKRAGAMEQALSNCPDYEADLAKYAAEARTGEFNVVDLPDDIGELVAEIFGVDEVSFDEEGGDDGNSGDAEDAGESKGLVAFHEAARAEVEDATNDVELARTGTKSVLKKAEARYKRALKAYDTARHADLERTLPGQLLLLSEDEVALGRLKDKYVLGRLSELFDYKIFMAVSERPGKTSSGQYLVRLDDEGKMVTDEHGNWLVDQDCVAYLEEDPPGIAEQYISWAAAQVAENG